MDSLASDISLPHSICRLLVGRGHHTAELAKPYLRPRLERLHDPLLMGGLDVAVDRLATAIRNGETVLIHGDYDVDGMASTALLARSIGALGGRVVPFIPSRLADGYDLTDAGVRAAIECGATVVLTADCGTSAVGPIASLVERGIDVIVSDHHLPGGALPDCLAVLNPRREGCDYPDTDLAAVGVAFKLALALTRAMGGDERLVMRQLDLVALATIADVAPLRGENRVFVRYGLRLMTEGGNEGLRALIRSSGLDGRPITAGRVGFTLAPRLNAAGRLGNALLGVRLLLSDSATDANRIARELEELNRRRQDHDREVLEQARAMVHAMGPELPRGLVLASEHWHAGVIGIVASRLVEEFGRPVILVALEGDEGKGSGRSIPAFDLHAGIGACSSHLVRYGGHRVAAGLSVRRQDVDAFGRAFMEHANTSLSDDDLVPVLRVDMEIPLHEANDELHRWLAHFEPFGIGNPSPVFVSRGVRVVDRPRAVGKDGIRLRLSDGAGELEAIGWGMAARGRQLAANDLVDVAYRLERDEYRGSSRLQARLADIRR